MMLVKRLTIWLFFKMVKKTLRVYVVIITSNIFKEDFIHNLKILFLLYKMGSNFDQGTIDFVHKL